MKILKEQLEEVIKKNLPDIEEHFCRFNDGECVCDCFQEVLSQIKTSIIADEVLKVVVEKIENIPVSETEDFRFRLKVVNLLRCPHKRIESNMSPLHCTDCGSLLSNLSTKENNK